MTVEQHRRFTPYTHAYHLGVRSLSDDLRDCFRCLLKTRLFSDYYVIESQLSTRPALQSSQIRKERLLSKVRHMSDFPQ